MANTETSLKECLSSIDGATAAALVDYTSGMALGTLGGGKDLNLEVAAAGNTDVVRSKLRTMELLGLKEEIEDILITLNSQPHPGPEGPFRQPRCPPGRHRRRLQGPRGRRRL
ncbi:hypothetical protein AB0H06_32945, partial [Streptomyces althioticus]|uniref:hypothetical protein n=1 Tax=Streptomyces althioticus TaxID=83380 RepID=UPI0033DA34C4